MDIWEARAWAGKSDPEEVFSCHCPEAGDDILTPCSRQGNFFLVTTNLAPWSLCQQTEMMETDYSVCVSVCTGVCVYLCVCMVCAHACVHVCASILVHVVINIGSRCQMSFPVFLHLIFSDSISHRVWSSPIG